MNDENEMIQEQEESKQKQKKKQKISPFLKSLREKQIAQARETLIQTVIERSSDTIGSIFDSLENDPDGEYIMLDFFKSMTIEDLVVAAAPKILGSEAYSEEDEGDEDEDELEDTDEYSDDGAEVEEEEEKPKKKRKKAPKKTGKSDADDSEYKSQIISCLRDGKAKDEDSAMSGADIRAQVGGDSGEFRSAIADLIELGKVEKFGKARGTKYARVRRKKTE